MRTTLLFTEAHEEELKRIATLDCFAAQVAKTILSRDFYRCSDKQASILNKVSDLEFFESDSYSNATLEKMQQRQRNLMYL